eukprot:83717-Prorocentrum_minimum.AAC.2
MCEALNLVSRVLLQHLLVDSAGGDVTIAFESISKEDGSLDTLTREALYGHLKNTVNLRVERALERLSEHADWLSGELCPGVQYEDLGVKLTRTTPRNSFKSSNPTLTDEDLLFAVVFMSEGGDNVIKGSTSTCDSYVTRESLHGLVRDVVDASIGAIWETIVPNSNDQKQVIDNKLWLKAYQSFKEVSAITVEAVKAREQTDGAGFDTVTRSRTSDFSTERASTGGNTRGVGGEKGKPNAKRQSKMSHDPPPLSTTKPHKTQPPPPPAKPPLGGAKVKSPPPKAKASPPQTKSSPPSTKNSPPPAKSSPPMTKVNFGGLKTSKHATSVKQQQQLLSIAGSTQPIVGLWEHAGPVGQAPVSSTTRPAASEVASLPQDERVPTGQQYKIAVNALKLNAFSKESNASNATHTPHHTPVSTSGQQVKSAVAALKTNTFGKATASAGASGSMPH